MEECKRKYVALSYTWGNPVARREIVVNGKPAFITENLYAALTHMLGLDGLLGSLLEDCELWIDALCINQQDAAEKYVQVANMRDVFANAGWVVAWMGPSADGSDELLRAVRDKEESRLLDVLVEGGELPFSPLALQSFLTRDWWSRMWILQEFMASYDFWFLCGHSYIHQYVLFGVLNAVLTYMDRASYYIVDTPFRDLLPWRMYLMLSKERSLSGNGVPLMELIEATKDAKCTDPRDRVFALLGLMSEEEKQSITCDYESAPCEVFCNAIRVMAMDTGVGRAAKVREEVDFYLWEQCFEAHQAHDPLEPVVPARWACDGIACSSLSLCLRIPERAKMSGKHIVQALIMGYRGRSQEASESEEGSV
jgi:hypothetical protein